MTLSTSAIARLEKHRQQFPALANKGYFNFGGQGPLPSPSLEAMYQAYEIIQQQGPFSGAVNQWLTQRGMEARRAIASAVGATPETITLTENVTVGCNIALWGIDWQAGDRILITDCEHPGIIATLGEISRRFQVEVTSCPILETLNNGDPTTVIEQHLHSNTRLVVLSHLLWNTGQVLPLADIVKLCHSYESHNPVQVLVDAAQSVGSLPLNLSDLEADFYAFTGHKWLCGPAGAGGLYVRPEARATLAPTFIGWRGILEDDCGNPQGWKLDGQKFEVATSSIPLFVGLQEAIALHQSWGTPQERYEQICRNSAYLWECLSELAGVRCLKASPPEAGLVSFQLPDGIPHKRAVQTLEQQGFCLRTLLNPDCIRACVHYFTLPIEMDRLVEAIAQLI